MTCILDYDVGHVIVTDMIYTRAATGRELHKSSYRKLGLDPSVVAGVLHSEGLAITRFTRSGGLAKICALKS